MVASLHRNDAQADSGYARSVTLRSLLGFPSATGDPASFALGNPVPAAPDGVGTSLLPVARSGTQLGMPGMPTNLWGARPLYENETLRERQYTKCNSKRRKY